MLVENGGHAMNRREEPVARNTIRLFQTHDTNGHVDEAEYIQEVERKTVNTLASDAMLFLTPLNLRQTKNEGVFLYEDTTRGSGWLRLENFSRTDSTRIQELIRMEEISRAVGKEPLRNADLSVGNAIALRSNNPWVIIGFGVFAVAGGIASSYTAFFTSAPKNQTEFVSLIIVAGLMVLVGCGAFISGGLRVSWWHKARAYARQQDGTLPSDLKGL